MAFLALAATGDQGLRLSTLFLENDPAHCSLLEEGYAPVRGVWLRVGVGQRVSWNAPRHYFVVEAVVAEEALVVLAVHGHGPLNLVVHGGNRVIGTVAMGRTR